MSIQGECHVEASVDEQRRVAADVFQLNGFLVELTIGDAVVSVLDRDAWARFQRLTDDLGASVSRPIGDQQQLERKRHALTPTLSRWERETRY